MNINPDTGIAFGYITADLLDPDILHELLYSQSTDLSYRDAQDEAQTAWEHEADIIDGNIACALAELDGNNMTDHDRESTEERLIAQHYGAVGADSREDFIEYHVGSDLENIQIDEPIHEGTVDGVHFRTSWLGGALNLWVFDSPHTGMFEQCSPCVPGAANLDEPCRWGILGYDVPPKWRADYEDEGWALFECDGRFALQRDDEAGTFASDADAIIFVALKANEGSQRHRAALEKIGSLA